MGDRLRIGVVGAGHLGALHAEKYRAMPAVELAGIHDTDRKRAAAVGARVGCPAIETLEELLASVAAVSVAVPVVAHESVGLAAVAAGCHVLMEKPLAASTEQGRRLLDAASRRGVVLQVGHIERFNPVVQELHHIIAVPQFLECHRLAPFAGRGADTDVILDVMIHDLDLIAFLVDDEVSSIDAVGVPVLSENVDIANVRLKFRRGCVANVTASRVSLKRERKLRIFQADGYVSMDFDARTALLARRDPTIPISSPADAMAAITVETREFGGADPLAAELEAFVAAVRGERTGAVAGEDALAALRLAERIRDSMEVPGVSVPGGRA